VAGARVDIVPGSTRECVYPSPVTALGMGYKRSIKPDLIAPGGRQLFRARPGGGNRPTTIVSPVMSSLAPGLLVATPSAQAGALNGTRHFQGTSGAAALVSHWCGLLLEK